MLLLSDVIVSWDYHICHSWPPLLLVSHRCVWPVSQQLLVCLELEVPQGLGSAVLNHFLLLCARLWCFFIAYTTPRRLHRCFSLLSICFLFKSVFLLVPLCYVARSWCCIDALWLREGGLWELYQSCYADVLACGPSKTLRISKLCWKASSMASVSSFHCFALLH